jgi:two-component system, NarL family, nitrate/nitrite response regulator NarL
MAVLVVSRMHFVGELLSQALRAKGDIVAIHGRVPGIVDTHAEEIMPDVVVVDSSHPAGFAVVSAIRAQFPSVNLVVLALSDREEDFLAWANIGISGYVPPETPLEELIAIIRRSAAGEVVCPPRLTALLLSRFASQMGMAKARGGVHHLTQREREVLEFLADGLSNKLIARRLRIAEATVKNHVHSILEKWDLRSRGEAAARYRESGQEHATRFRNTGPRLAPVKIDREMLRAEHQ